MKLLWPSIFLFAFRASVVTAQVELSGVTLTGIVSLPGYKCATLLVAKNNIHADVSGVCTLQEGQRDGLRGIEMLAINPVTGVVKITNRKTPLDLAFKSDGGTGTTQSAGANSATEIRLQDMPMSGLLDLFGNVTRRTVLHPALFKKTFTLRASVNNQEEAAVVLANALKEQGIIAIVDGDKFVKVIPETQATTAELQSIQAQSFRKTKVIAPPEPQGQSIEAGDIDFPAISVQQVLEVYAALLGAQRFEPGPEDSSIMSQTISLKTQTSLSKKEAIYALDTVFSESGFKAVLSTNNSISIVRLPTH